MSTGPLCSVRFYREHQDLLPAPEQPPQHSEALTYDCSKRKNDGFKTDLRLELNTDSSLCHEHFIFLID